MRRWKYVCAVAAAAAAVTALTAGVSAEAKKDTASTIAQRIHIGEVDVSGMTEEEASKAVEGYVEDLQDEEITLKAGENTVTATVEELGLVWGDETVAEDALNYGKTGNLIARYKANKDLEHEDKVFPIILKADKEKTAEFLEEHKDDLGQPAKDYGLERKNGGFTVIDGEAGVEVNIEKSLDTVNQYFADGWIDEAQIELEVTTAEPKGSKEELLKVKDVLGTYHTNFSSSASGRVKNIQTAAGKINGSLIYPGEEFSVYDVITPMDAQHGYALAGSYENGTTVQSYGGGVCQVSTTLYNAVIRAELEITERFAHSMIVSYVDPSSDAAIAGTYKNLKFKNNTEAPVYIEGYTVGRDLYFTVYGQETRDADREVIFESETLSTTQPKTEFKTTSAALGSVTKVQSSHTGRKAQLWKIVRVGGVEKSREVFNKSTYNASPAIYEVGLGGASEEASAAIKKAIASGDLGTVKAAVSKWKAQQEEEEKQEEQKKEEQKNEEQDKQDSEEQKTENSGSDQNKQDTDQNKSEE